ncbi:AAA family ATPase [bacterium]|nr:AAA family ATPase [bacterium]
MPTPLELYTADHKYLLDATAKAAGIDDPVSVQLDAYFHPVLTKATRGPIVPVDDVLVRDWDRDHTKTWPGIKFGIRTYTLGGVRFARCCCTFHSDLYDYAYDFVAVARMDYLKLFRLAVQAKRESAKQGLPPVLPPEHLETLRQNTLGYLDRTNLRRIKELGGRAKRGLLLTGPPGNGKTSACRWLWQECLRLRYEYKMVTPDAYRAARSSGNPVQAVKELFTVDRRGLVFFDDMDIALRDRNTVHETDDQAVFLSALDGIEVNEGVVYVFTTNCSLDLIDPAFKRPGRIDLVLHFHAPDATLRRELIDRWHADVKAGIDVDAAVRQTEGYSFAEVEELKNLLILNFIEGNGWDWGWAMTQFGLNRQELASRAAVRHVGFGVAEQSRNGF